MGTHCTQAVQQVLLGQLDQAEDVLRQNKGSSRTTTNAATASPARTSSRALPGAVPQGPSTSRLQSVDASFERMSLRTSPSAGAHGQSQPHIRPSQPQSASPMTSTDPCCLRVNGRTVPGADPDRFRPDAGCVLSMLRVCRFCTPPCCLLRAAQYPCVCARLRLGVAHGICLTSSCRRRCS